MREAPAGSGLRYVCALAYVDPAAGTERVFFGDSRGRLSPESRGNRGFGYDPVFLPEGDFGGRTMAELTDEEKDLISHRGRAVRGDAALAQRGGLMEAGVGPRAAEDQAAHGGAVGRLQLGPDPAQGDRRDAHRIGRRS